MTYRVFIEKVTRVIVQETTDDALDPPDGKISITLDTFIDHSHDNGIQWWKLTDDLQRIPATDQDISDAGVSPEVEAQKAADKFQAIKDALVVAIQDPKLPPSLIPFIKAMISFYGP